MVVCLYSPDSIGYNSQIINIESHKLARTVLLQKEIMALANLLFVEFVLNY